MDTLKGYINYKEHAFNPTSFTFKSTSESKPQIFTLKNCSAFVISDIDAYQRFAVNISMNSLNVSDLSTGLDSASRRDTVFLRVLQRGKNVTLFSYRDDLKKRFYVQDREEKVPYELLKQVFLDKDHASAIVNRDSYKYQLLQVMRKFNVSSATVEEKLNSLSYAETDILRIVSIINDHKTTISKYPKARFFAGLGVNYNQTYYSGQNDLAGPNAVSKDSYSPIVKAGVDLFANPAIGKLIYRLELSLLSTKSDISIPRPNDDGFSENVSFTQYSASFTPQIIYNIYNSQPLKFFVGGGVALNVSTFSNNRHDITNYYGQVTPVQPQDLNGLTFSVPFSAGIVLHKRLEVSAGYTLPFSISSYDAYSIQMKMFRAGISYFFGK